MDRLPSAARRNRLRLRQNDSPLRHGRMAGDRPPSGAYPDPMLAPDEVLSRIERFNRTKGGGVVAEYRQGGYTLRFEATGAPIARLKPTGRADRMDILYWSHKGKWSDFGPFGGTTLPLDEALDFIARQPLFWTLA